jgi:hypothetical protein
MNRACWGNTWYILDNTCLKWSLKVWRFLSKTRMSSCSSLWMKRDWNKACCFWLWSCASWSALNMQYTSWNIYSLLWPHSSHDFIWDDFSSPIIEQYNSNISNIYPCPFVSISHFELYEDFLVYDLFTSSSIVYYWNVLFIFSFSTLSFSYCLVFS